MFGTTTLPTLVITGTVWAPSGAVAKVTLGVVIKGFAVGAEVTKPLLTLTPVVDVAPVAAGAVAGEVAEGAVDEGAEDENPGGEVVPTVGAVIGAEDPPDAALPLEPPLDIVCAATQAVSVKTNPTKKMRDVRIHNSFDCPSDWITKQ